MIDFIQGEFKKIILKCCAKYNKDVALILGIDEEGTNAYTIIEYLYDYEENQMKGFKWDEAQHLTILQVLGVKIDILNYSGLAEPFIQKSILRFSEQLGIHYSKISMICFPTQRPKLKRKQNETDEDEYVYDREGNVVYVDDVDIYLYDGRTQEHCIYKETISFSDLFNEQDLIPTTE
jgi:hypothetical protein